MEQWNSCENNYSKAKYYDYIVLEKRKWWYKHFRVEIVYEFFTSSSSMLLVITHLIYLLTFKYKREETNVEKGFRVFYSIKKKRGLHCFSSNCSDDFIFIFYWNIKRNCVLVKQFWKMHGWCQWLILLWNYIFKNVFWKTYFSKVMH